MRWAFTTLGDRRWWHKSRRHDGIEGRGDDMHTGTKVKWMGRKAVVLGQVPSFTNLRKIELEGGEVKEVNVASLLEDVPADPRDRLPQDVQEALRVCEKVLTGPNANVLANILGASTRGPDIPHTVKGRTTSVLRTAAFGKGGSALGDAVPVAPITRAILSEARTAVSGHFADHVEQAATRLGLVAP